jgi:hypothetical protein
VDQDGDSAAPTTYPTFSEHQKYYPKSNHVETMGKKQQKLKDRITPHVNFFQQAAKER